VTPDEEWKFVPTGAVLNGHYYITGVGPKKSHATYLSVEAHPKQGSPVIHSSTKTVWAVNYGGGGVRCVDFLYDITIVSTNYTSPQVFPFLELV
jgi:hypothetical protein